MDLIYTNAQRADLGVLFTHSFDLSYGDSENDFELTVGANEAPLEAGAFVYIDGTEYGGIIDGVKTSTNGETITYIGRTWHGILNSKVIEPDPGDDYFVISGYADDVLPRLINRLDLSDLFVASEEISDISWYAYKFPRYCKGYDGIRTMLEKAGAKLRIAWENRSVKLSAVPISDYSKLPVDGDTATLTVEQHNNKVNHLICLGKGDLAAREVIHLYVDNFGRIGESQHRFGVDEITDTYDNSNSEDLYSDGIEHFAELRSIDKAEIAISETEGLTYDIGDIVGATEYKSGVSVAEKVTQKIVKINNGVVITEYKTGR